MQSASEELKKLRLMAENSLTKTDELDNLLSQVEALLSRKNTEIYQTINK